PQRPRIIPLLAKILQEFLTNFILGGTQSASLALFVAVLPRSHIFFIIGGGGVSIFIAYFITAVVSLSIRVLEKGYGLLHLLHGETPLLCSHPAGSIGFPPCLTSKCR